MGCIICNITNSLEYDKGVENPFFCESDEDRDRFHLELANDIAVSHPEIVAEIERILATTITKYYGYPIVKEGKEEFCVKIYADDITGVKDIIKKCLEAGIIEWPVQAAGRRKHFPEKNGG